MPLWQGCPYKTKDSNSLKKHVRTHTKEKMIACPYCGETYRENAKFDEHIYKASDHNSSTESYSRELPSASKLNEAEDSTTEAANSFNGVLLNTLQRSSYNTATGIETTTINETFADSPSTNDTIMDAEMAYIYETLTDTPSTSDNLPQQNEEYISLELSWQQNMPLDSDGTEENSANPVAYSGLFQLFPGIMHKDPSDSTHNALSSTELIQNDESFSSGIFGEQNMLGSDRAEENNVNPEPRQECLDLLDKIANGFSDSTHNALPSTELIQIDESISPGIFGQQNMLLGSDRAEENNVNPEPNQEFLDLLDEKANDPSDSTHNSLSFEEFIQNMGLQSDSMETSSGIVQDTDKEMDTNHN